MIMIKIEEKILEVSKEMYSNEEFNLLKNNQSRFSDTKLNSLIDMIENYYNEFNKNIARYTSNYVETMKNIMNELSIKNLIDKDYGGNLYVTPSNQENIENIIQKTMEYVKKLNDLKYLSFLSEENRNVIFVGANGCGKTTLLRHLIELTGDRDIAYYQADRLLLVDSTYNPERDEKSFLSSLNSTTKYSTDINYSQQGYYINRQLNQVIALFEKKRSSELEQQLRGEISKEMMKTELILKKWNELIQDRVLFIDGNLKVKTCDENEYSIKYLSSGEKSIFYFLASIILQPQKKYYFIDEPENNLNPSVVTRLWDTIEECFPESNFVYLTHDKDFVSTRINTKIYWIKKYDGENWKYELLPENDDLPKELMISLVGNRQPVLFCESENETKFDSIVFKLMFPEFKVVPCGGCAKVINKVKAYKTLEFPTKAYGIIDCDYRDESFLIGQQKHNIYYLPFFEIENFLFCEEILSKMLVFFKENESFTLNIIKQRVKEDFKKNKEIFVIRNVATRLHELGFRGGIKRLNSREELKKNYEEFSNSVNLNEMLNEYDKKFDEIVEKDDFNTFLRFYDNKNILNDYNDEIKLGNGVKYEDEVLLFLHKNRNILSELRKKYLSSII